MKGSKRKGLFSLYVSGNKAGRLLRNVNTGQLISRVESRPILSESITINLPQMGGTLGSDCTLTR